MIFLIGRVIGRINLGTNNNDGLTSSKKVFFGCFGGGRRNRLSISNWFCFLYKYSSSARFIFDTYLTSSIHRSLNSLHQWTIISLRSQIKFRFAPTVHSQRSFTSNLYPPPIFFTQLLSLFLDIGRYPCRQIFISTKLEMSHHSSQYPQSFPLLRSLLILHNRSECFNPHLTQLIHFNASLHPSSLVAL